MAEFESEFFIDYSSLDDFQRQLIDRKNNKPLVVKGCAGSGKSLIALHKANQLASLGHSYVIVVYTKTLRKYFSDGLRKLGLRNVYHYHQWRHNQEHVKYMIVDECQDFTHEQIEEFKKWADICFFFGDTDQSIMSFNEPKQSVEETAHGLRISPMELYFNYRLTKQVAILAEKVGDVEDLVIKCKREGEKPHLISEKNFDKQLDRIAEIIRNGQLTNVGILLPFNTMEKAERSYDGVSYLSVEYVKDYLLDKGVTCEFKYDDLKATEMDVDFHSKNPKIMTWWCAKGLQFKDVFVPGCEQNYDEERQSAFYVAITRCCERLYLSYSNSLNSFFPADTRSLCVSSDNLNML